MSVDKHSHTNGTTSSDASKTAQQQPQAVQDFGRATNWRSLAGDETAPDTNNAEPPAESNGNTAPRPPQRSGTAPGLTEEELRRLFNVASAHAAQVDHITESMLPTSSLDTPGCDNSDGPERGNGWR